MRRIDSARRRFDERSVEMLYDFGRSIRKRLRLIEARLSRRQFGQAYYDETLRRALGPAIRAPVAIRDHLSDLYFFTLLARPRLIVELGTRGGDSTRAFLAAARFTNAAVLSIDIEPCGELDVEPDLKSRWHFVQSDDVAFGRERFAAWSADRGLPPKAQLIFIDSSHLYDHSKAELEVWMEWLDEDGWMLFHDTNMASVYFRYDNSIGLGWDNQRGVLRAIEERLGRSYDENSFFVDVTKEFLVWHRPNSSGLTVLKKLPPNAI